MHTATFICSSNSGLRRTAHLLTRRRRGKLLARTALHFFHAPFSATPGTSCCFKRHLLALCSLSFYCHGWHYPRFRGAGGTTGVSPRQAAAPRAAAAAKLLPCRQAPRANCCSFSSACCALLLRWCGTGVDFRRRRAGGRRDDVRTRDVGGWVWTLASRASSAIWQRTRGGDRLGIASCLFSSGALCAASGYLPACTLLPRSGAGTFSPAVISPYRDCRPTLPPPRACHASAARRGCTCLSLPALCRSVLC